MKRLPVEMFVLTGLLVAVAASAQTTRPAIPPPAPPAMLDAQRVREIEATLRPLGAGLGPTVADRTAWATAAKLPSVQRIVTVAESRLAEKLPDLPDDLYLDFSRTGNRDRWQSAAFTRREWLGQFVLAECAENRGRFVPRISEILDAMCAERTWVWPAHDPKLENYHGRSVIIDLGAAEAAAQTASALWLLGERLNAQTQAGVRARLNERIVEPYLAAIERRGPAFRWMTQTNNWNSVCHAGVLTAVLTVVDDPAVRAKCIASAEVQSRRFLEGFGADGYCEEGLSYWNYGFGQYVVLTETVRHATGGKVDFFDDARVQKIAAFGVRNQIVNGVSPAFADCAVYPMPAPQLMRYADARFGLRLNGHDIPEVISPRFFVAEQAAHLSLDAASLRRPVVVPADGAASDGAASEESLRTWFDQAGVLIARPGPAGASASLGVAIKGGHNAELHNHNDLGSFVAVVGEKCVLLDPGVEHYTARTFGPRRYEGKLLNSFGHSVPVVAGSLQKAGADAQAKVVRTEFSPLADTIVMDLTSAYPVPDLKRLERTFTYSRAGKGSLTITDRVEFAKPQQFTSALITLGEIADLEASTFTVRDGNERLGVSVETDGALVKIASEPIVEDAPVKPLRITIDLTAPVPAATVTIRVTPL